MVAVVGRANVGKSTLVNALLGEKVSIVSHVVQTTRNTIRGILTEPRGQIVFLDTPGVHRATNDLGKFMNRMARNAVEGVDAVLLVLDGSTRPRQEDEGWMRRLMREEMPCFAVLNKSDTGKSHASHYEAQWAQAATELDLTRTVEWRSVSALEGTGVDELLVELLNLMPEGPLLFPADVLTDFPRNLAVADVIREKLLRDLREELPHSVAVAVDSIHEDQERWDIRATVYVRKFSQKGIVIGEKGRRLRSVRRASERELSELYERDVAIKLWVKVEKEWPQNFWFLKKLGYVD